MKKLIISLALLLSLSNCYYYRESLGRYNLPVTDIKDPLKEGKVCNDEDNYPFDMTSDLTVETARKRGKISNIIAIEKEVSGHLLKRKKCIIVKGN